ncbi:unnamed protein product, partial [Agarophyton chilense]
SADLTLDIQRVTSEHFPAANLPNTNTNTNTNPNPNATAAAAAAPHLDLSFTFQSLLSYGHTEQSSASLPDNPPACPNALVGNAYANTVRPPLERTTWSATQLLLPSRVEQAAGPLLYRRGAVDSAWRLNRRLGMGACAEVRLGESVHPPSRTAAVKVVSKRAPDLFCPVSGECRELLAFRTMGTHPNLVRCHAVYEDERFIYIVMDLLTGGHLLPRITEKHTYYPRYCENDVVTVVRALLRALAHLHANGIAHRDVKPENILYVSQSRDPTVRLTDFGIAHCDAHNHPATDMVGTPLYIAPEVLLRHPYGCAADMWSLGVITHILLVGFPPFDDDDLVTLVNKVKFNRPTLRHPHWRFVSHRARHFVRHLLHRQVPHRLTAQQALAHPWLTEPRPPPFPAPPIPIPATHSAHLRAPPPSS